MRELIVLRHGETEANVAGIAQGRQPYPLTETGRAQAAAAGRFMERLAWRPTHVLSSPVARCVESASIVTGVLGLDSARTNEAFTEIDCGSAEGMAFRDIAFKTGFDQFGGESNEQLFARVGAGLDALPDDEIILLVTHGGIFKAILHHLLGVRGQYWLGLRCGTCMRLEKRGPRHALSHLLHPEEVE
ncbi:MAG: histidine phosphatase family protein [Planctomycetota bacterium]